MRRFIADGYLVLQPSVPGELHRTICRNIAAAVPGTDNPGNNILPLVPEMRHVLESPEVHGALLTLLGPGYLEHPHRYCHVEALQDLAGLDYAAKLASNSHQDSYTPLGRPRHHHIRFVRVMYYPQDTPHELGPTHVIPGTHLNRGLSDAEKAHQLSGQRRGRYGQPDPLRHRARRRRQRDRTAPLHGEVHLHARRLPAGQRLVGSAVGVAQSRATHGR